MSHLFLAGKHPACTQEKKIMDWQVLHSTDECGLQQNTCTGTVCSITVIESDQKKGDEKYYIKLVKKYLSWITEGEKAFHHEKTAMKLIFYTKKSQYFHSDSSKVTSVKFLDTGGGG